MHDVQKCTLENGHGVVERRDRHLGLMRPANNEAKAEARQCEVEMRLRPRNSCEAEAKNYEVEAATEAKR